MVFKITDPNGKEVFSVESTNPIKSNGFTFLGKSCIIRDDDLSDPVIEAFFKNKNAMEKLAKDALLEDIGREIDFVKQDMADRTHDDAQYKELELVENLYKAKNITKLISILYKDTKSIYVSIHKNIPVDVKRNGFEEITDFSFDMGKYSGNLFYGYSCIVFDTVVGKNKYDCYIDHSD